MNTSQQEIIANLKSCLPIYKKLYKIPGYQMPEDEFGCLKEFYKLWDAGALDDETLLEEVGINYEMYGMLLGYAALTVNPPVHV